MSISAPPNSHRHDRSPALKWDWLHFQNGQSVLSEFRTRLIDGNYEQRLLDTMLAQLEERGVLKARGVARQSKQVSQRQSAIHPMVEQCLAGKLMSSPKPPTAGARRARLYSSLPARHHNCRMQLPMDEAHQRQ
jgi:hypothetical protein